jgi:meiotically up-regulated gene 157 (Mug157) protein
MKMIRRQMQCVLYDPYANAFNEEENGRGHVKDRPLQKPMVWERKYEIDSLCFVLWLCCAFRRDSCRTSFLQDGLFEKTFRTILALWRTEQRHGENSPYLFVRENCRPKDTLTHDGKGEPVAFTGMTWSGFRPSDDRCVYGYLIPSNLFAVTVLRETADLIETDLGDVALADEARKLADEIDAGVRQYGIVEHPQFGRMYAYETDGMGNYVFMDDSNVPSLLSIPYFGYCDAHDPIYQNTRRFILSKENPFYYEGSVLCGTGSPHTPEGYVWHIGLSLQALTAIDEDERMRVLRMLEASDGGTGFMHEGVCADDPTVFTRPWFAWSNSIFSELLLQYAEKLEAGE